MPQGYYSIDIDTAVNKVLESFSKLQCCRHENTEMGYTGLALGF